MLERVFELIDSGCRAGNACPFQHDTSRLDNVSSEPDVNYEMSEGGHATRGLVNDRHTTSPPARPPVEVQPERHYTAPPVAHNRVVQRPTPRTQVEDPRTFQIQQVKRRFSPAETADEGGTTLSFQMAPSDPDFPFELEGLECVLHVPAMYPNAGVPSLKVRNKEMGRGFQINVERGFDVLVQRSPQATLLGLMNTLDKQLESLLTEEKAQTITFVPNVGPRYDTGSKAVHMTPDTRPAKLSEPKHSTPGYTTDQLQAARVRREVETRQLEARLGRLQLFSKSSDGTAFDIPIEPRRSEDLPVPLQAVKAVKLFVPLLYPLQHCKIEIPGVSRAAAAKTERAFERKVMENPETTLMRHMNYLAQHMQVFATEPEQDYVEQTSQTKDTSPQIEHLSVEDLAPESKVSPPLKGEDDRSHIRLIPRPPEWLAERDEEPSEESDFSVTDDSSDTSNHEESEYHAVEASLEIPSDSGPERGISLSFPSLELYGIELLELVSLSITVKCDRCKDVLDISNLRNGSSPSSASCKKCASTFTLQFRRELMHGNSVRAGYLDLDGCTVLDMLPRYNVSRRSSSFRKHTNTHAVPSSPPARNAPRPSPPPASSRFEVHRQSRSAANAIAE